MRMNFGPYMMCVTAVLGMVACQQQQQQQQAQAVESVLPAEKATVQQRIKVKPRPRVAPRPKVKPAPVKPVEAETAPVVSPAPKAEPVVIHPAQTPAVLQPRRLAPLARRVSHVPMKGKYVALTFDDGPHASLTPKALDILKRHGAKGTFFMLGSNAVRNKSVVERAAAEGHELGVHTWTHIKMNSTSRAKVDSEISRTQNLLAQISGTYPRVMRPPYGATNKTLVNHMHSRYGMASVLWDVDTLDWRKPGVGAVVNTAVSKARPGSIILVHDIHASTLNALEDIVTGLQARGFTLVTVSELLTLARQEAQAPASPETLGPEAPAATAPAEEPVLPRLPEPPADVSPQSAEHHPHLTEQQEAALHAASDEAPVLPPAEEYVYPSI